MIAITGATGQLGHYVIESLMKHKALPCVRLTTAMKPH